MIVFFQLIGSKTTQIMWKLGHSHYFEIDTFPRRRSPFWDGMQTVVLSVGRRAVVIGQHSDILAFEGSVFLSNQMVRSHTDVTRKQ